MFLHINISKILLLLCFLLWLIAPINFNESITAENLTFDPINGASIKQTCDFSNLSVHLGYLAPKYSFLLLKYSPFWCTWHIRGNSSINNSDTLAGQTGLKMLRSTKSGWLKWQQWWCANFSLGFLACFNSFQCMYLHLNISKILLVLWLSILLIAPINFNESASLHFHILTHCIGCVVAVRSKRSSNRTIASVDSIYIFKSSLLIMQSSKTISSGNALSSQLFIWRLRV